MVRSITPRGVGRPDNERELHRVSVHTFRRNQELWSYSTSFNIPPYSYRTVYLTDFDLTEKWRLFITDVIVTANKNLRLLVDVIKGATYIGSKWNVQKVHIKIPSGAEFSKTDELYVFIVNYDTSEDVDVTLYIGGVKELKGE